MSHHILHPVAVIGDIPAGNGGISPQGIGDDAGNIPYAGVVGVFHLLEIEGFLTPLHLICAKGIGFHSHDISLLKKKGRNLAVLIIKVYELRLGLLYVHSVVEGAVFLGPEGIQHLETVHVQEFDDEFRLGAVLENTADVGFLRIAGKENGAKQCTKDNAAKVSHTLQRF